MDAGQPAPQAARGAAAGALTLCGTVETVVPAELYARNRLPVRRACAKVFASAAVIEDSAPAKWHTPGVMVLGDVDKRVRARLERRRFKDGVRDELG
jgi:hypothetical protein